MSAAKLITTLFCLGTAATLTSCAQFKQGWDEGMNQANYTDQMKTGFVSACIQSAEKNLTQERAKSYCECSYDRISSTVPVDEFVKFDSGETISDQTRTALKVAIAQCGGEASRL